MHRKVFMISKTMPGVPICSIGDCTPMDLIAMSGEYPGITGCDVPKLLCGFLFLFSSSLFSAR